MIHIPVVQPDPIVPFDRLASVDLSPAGDAGTNVEHVELLRRVSIVGPGMISQGRPRPDQGHVALEDVDELGQLIDGSCPEDSPDLCDPLVPDLGIHTGPGMLGVLDHGAKLIDQKHLSVIADPLLLEQNGTAGVQVDGQSGEEHERGQENKGKQGYDDVQDSFDDRVVDLISSFQRRSHPNAIELLISGSIRYPGGISEQAGAIRAVC